MKKLSFLMFFVAITIGSMMFAQVSKACCVYRVYPQISSVTADPDSLWPPNHKLVEVTLDLSGYNINDWWVSGVEATNFGKGEGDPANNPDYEFSGKMLKLRAERAGKKEGAREYIVSVTASSGDAYGTTVTIPVSVIVPHDMSGGQGREKAPGQL